MDPNQGYGYNSYPGYNEHPYSGQQQPQQPQQFSAAQASTSWNENYTYQGTSRGQPEPNPDGDMERRLHLSDANPAMITVGTGLLTAGALLLRGAFQEKPKYKPPPHVLNPQWAQGFHGRYEDYKPGTNPNAHLTPPPLPTYETGSSAATTYGSSSSSAHNMQPLQPSQPPQKQRPSKSGATSSANLAASTQATYASSSSVVATYGGSSVHPVQSAQPIAMQPQKSRPSKSGQTLASFSAPASSQYGLYNASGQQRPSKTRPGVNQSMPAMGTHHAAGQALSVSRPGYSATAYQGFNDSGPNQPVTGSVLAPNGLQGNSAGAAAATTAAGTVPGYNAHDQRVDAAAAAAFGHPHVSAGHYHVSASQPQLHQQHYQPGPYGHYQHHHLPPPSGPLHQHTHQPPPSGPLHAHVYQPVPAGHSWSTAAIAGASTSAQPPPSRPQYPHSVVPSDTISISASALAHDAAEAGFGSMPSMYRPENEKNKETKKKGRRQSASPRLQTVHTSGLTSVPEEPPQPDAASERASYSRYNMSRPSETQAELGLGPLPLSTAYMEVLSATHQNEANRRQQMAVFAQSIPAIPQQLPSGPQQNMCLSTGALARPKKQVHFPSGV